MAEPRPPTLADSLSRWALGPVAARPLWLRYAVPFLAVLAVWLAKTALDPWIPSRLGTPFLLMPSGIMLAAWYGGLGPGLLTTALALAVSAYFFIEPHNSFAIGRPADEYRMLVFGGEGALISLFAQALHAARRRSLEDHAALAESESRLRAAFEQAAAGIAQVSVDGRWLRVNAKLCGILGHPLADLLGRDVRDFTHPDDRAAEHEKVASLLEGRADNFLLEKRYLHREGHPVWVQLARSVVRDPDGRPLYFIGVVQDLTARKEAEEAEAGLRRDLESLVEERTEALQEANHELEAFAYSVSHDLRAPLRHIDGFAQLLGRQAEAGLSETGRRYLKTIQDTVKNAGKLVDELLAFSRMGRAELRQTPVELTALIEEVRRELAPDTAGRAITWKIGPLPTVHADPAMLRQVMVNLLSNAIKYTRGRPEAVIEVGAQDGGPAAGDRELVFFVRDNGAGFDMKYLDKLFGVFQRLHRTDEFEGTGIGLANVRRIILRHRGRVWAEGAAGAGATFYFSLPKQPERPWNPRSSRSSAKPEEITAWRPS